MRWGRVRPALFLSDQVHSHLGPLANGALGGGLGSSLN